jgi:hypothetical protein
MPAEAAALRAAPQRRRHRRRPGRPGGGLDAGPPACGDAVRAPAAARLHRRQRGRARARRGRQPVRVDVPLRVFYPGYYPTLTRLYDALGVPSEPVSYASSFLGPLVRGRPQACTSATATCAWRGHRWSLVAPQDLLAAPARAGHPGRAAALSPRRRRLRGSGGGRPARPSATGWLRRATRAAFVEGFLLPAIGTVCTCSHRAGARFPATVIIDYLARGLTRQSVRRALHGADDVQRRLLLGIPTCAATRPSPRVQRRRARRRCVCSWTTAARALRPRGAGHARPTRRCRLLADASGRRDAACWRLPLPAGAGADAHRCMADAGAPAPLVAGEPAPGRRPTAGPPSRRSGSMPCSRCCAARPTCSRPCTRCGGPGDGCWAAPLRPTGGRCPQPAALLGLQALQAEPGRRVWFCGSLCAGRHPAAGKRGALGAGAPARAGLAQPDQPLGGTIGRVAPRTAGIAQPGGAAGRDQRGRGGGPRQAALPAAAPLRCRCRCTKRTKPPSTASSSRSRLHVDETGRLQLLRLAPSAAPGRRRARHTGGRRHAAARRCAACGPAPGR